MLRLRIRAGSPADLAAGAAVLAVVGYPLEELLRQGFFPVGHISLGVLRRVANPETLSALRNTLLVSLSATAAALVVGVAFALLVQRSDFPARGALGIACLLPLLIPPFVGALAWLEAYARGGLTFHWWGVDVTWLRSGGGVAALLAVQGYPLAYLLVAGQLGSRRGAELEEAARASGAGPWQTLRDVSLPLLMPSLLAAAFIVFVSSASDFGVPAVLGIPAGFTVVTTLIYRQLSFSAGTQALPDAMALSLILAAAGIAALWALAQAGRDERFSPLVNRPADRRQLHFGVWRWPVAAAIWLFLLALVGLPLLALVLQSLNAGFGVSLSPVDWTGAHFADALAHGGVEALGRSLLLSLTAGVLIAGAGAIVARAARRGGFLPRRIADLATLPLTLPGSVVAVATILAWQRWLYGTLWIILLAYLARFAVFGVRAAGTGMAAIPPELEEAARSSGASPLRAAWDIERPLIQRSLLAGFTLVVLFAVHELTISSLLYTPGTETVAVKVLDAQQSGDLAITAALAVIVTAATFTFALPLAFSRSARRVLDLELAG